VIDLPSLDTFSAVLSDGRFPLAIGCAVLAGLTRGFSGFGSALVYIPLMSALYSPHLAVGSFVLIDLAVDAMLLPMVWRHVQWRAVLPMAAAAVFAAQFGALILQYAEPLHLRWAITAIVLAIVVVLASGWRYRGEPRMAITLMVGALSGFLGGALQVAGPPVIVYWLGGTQEVAVIRGNFIGYFTLLSLGSFWTYVARGLLTPEVIAFALFTGPVQVLATWGGAKLFQIASAAQYRRIAYLVIALTAIASMPLFDGMWRTAGG
jgi:uncharacterized membrane protein YfcA